MIDFIPDAGPTAYDSFRTMADPQLSAAWRETLAESLRTKDFGTNDFQQMLTFYQGHVAAAHPDILADQVRAAIESIRGVRVAETNGSAFPHASALAVRRSAALMHRIKLASVMTRISYDTELAAGDVAAAQERSREQEFFASSADLHRGIYLLEAYCAPLMGAMSPAVWAIPSYAANGPILLNLGRAIAGASGDAKEPLQSLGGGHGPDEVVEWPELRPDSPQAAVSWWTYGLNGLFGLITDPSTYNDDQGNYSPARNLQTLLTVEQLFRRVHSIQLAHRDTHARRVLLFTVLDTLESLTGRNVETLCSLSHAKATVRRLRESLSESAQDVLMYSADRAVIALEKVQSGFFMKSDDGSIPIEFKAGEPKPVDPERAAALFIKVLRDATHGHGSHRAGSRARTESLLAHHNGRVPHDLGLLGYVYLLDILRDPRTLARAIERR